MPDQPVSMVDITPKNEIIREATAVGRIRLKPDTIKRIRAGEVEKGDPISTGQVAAVLAAKHTSQLIPLCHPIPITAVKTSWKIEQETLEVESFVRASAKTGVEMEALAAVSAFLLTVWDMVKQYEKDAAGQYPTTIIEEIRVKKKVKAPKK